MIPDADAETRRKLIDELERWNSVVEIIPRVKQAYSSLAEESLSGKPIAPELVDTARERSRGHASR